MEEHPGPADLDVLRERLAAIEHERWAHWQRWMHSTALRHADGSITLPAELVARWERQIATPYADLSEAEKRSDREQVDRYWPLVEVAVAGPSDWALTIFDQRDAALEAVARVRKLHRCSRPDPRYADHCTHCLHPWPCETTQALEGSHG